MIKIYHKTTKDLDLQIVDNLKIGSWVRVYDPSEKEINYLIDEIGLEEGLVRDALDPFEVPRMEIDEGIVYVYTRVPHKEGDRIITLPVMIAVADKAIVTVSKKELPFIHEFVAKESINTTQKAKLLLQLFAEVDKAYQNFITRINRSVREVDVRLTRIENKDIVEFVRFEKILNDFLSALTATNAVLNNLLKGKSMEFYEGDKDFIEDMFLSSGQLIQTAKSNLRNIVNIREAYSTIMSQDLNRVIKILTVLTILLNVPVLVASLYGMNVALPGSGSPNAFWWIIGWTGGITLIVLAILIQKRWIK
ncbi:MAG: magnesium transporter CorA family protein [Parcubacteria group bacterium]